MGPKGSKNLGAPIGIPRYFTTKSMGSNFGQNISNIKYIEVMLNVATEKLDWFSDIGFGQISALDIG